MVLDSASDFIGEDGLKKTAQEISSASEDFTKETGTGTKDTGTTTYVVAGPKIEKFAARTDFSNIHGVNRLRDIMKKMGIIHELERQGATSESLIRIGDSEEFPLLEQ